MRDAPLPEGSTARPRRTCVGCRTTRAKDALLRLAKTPDGVQADPQMRLPGRGVYVCPTTTCIEAAAHRGGQAVRRALRGAPEHEVREALETLRRIATPDRPAAAPPQALKEHNA